MRDQWRRLLFLLAIGLTILLVSFPPFSVNGGPDEYAFALSAPPSARQAYEAAWALGGQQGGDMVGEVIHYSIDVLRLLIQLAVVWSTYLALRQTVMKGASA